MPNTWLQRGFKPYSLWAHQKLTEDEREAVIDYTGNTYKRINKYLRSGKKTGVTPKTLNTLEHLTSAFKKAPKSYRNSTVYRGCHGLTLAKMNKMFEDMCCGNLSTTYAPGVAKSFIGANKCCGLILRLPKGTVGIYVGKSSLFPKEDEVILPHRTKIKIHGTKVMENGPLKGKTVLMTEVVSQKITSTPCGSNGSSKSGGKSKQKKIAKKTTSKPKCKPKSKSKSKAALKPKKPKPKKQCKNKNLVYKINKAGYWQCMKKK